MLNGHQCARATSTYFRNITVVDSRGFKMEVAVQFCDCEPDFLRLLRFNLWSATPTKPELAFTIDLMKLLHTLNLECQVAVKDLCAAVEDLSSFQIRGNYIQSSLTVLKNSGYIVIDYHV